MTHHSSTCASEGTEKCDGLQCIQKTTPNVDGDQTLDPLSGQEQLQHQDTDIEKNVPPTQNQESPKVWAMKIKVGWHALAFMYWLMSLITVVVMAKVYRGLILTECKN